MFPNILKCYNHSIPSLCTALIYAHYVDDQEIPYSIKINLIASIPLSQLVTISGLCNNVIESILLFRCQCHGPFEIVMKRCRLS